MPDLQKSDNIGISLQDRTGSGVASWEPWEVLLMVSRGVKQK